MIALMGLIVILVVSIMVFGSWLFLRAYCLTATSYLSKHPKSDFVIHVFTGLGSGWLIGLWMPKSLALVLGGVLVVVAFVMRWVIPTAKLPEKLRSSGMGGGLPVGVGIAWLTYTWTPDVLTLILGTVSIVAAEIVHYLFPNLMGARKIR